MTLAELLENQKKFWGSEFSTHKRSLEDLVGFIVNKSWGELQLSLNKPIPSEQIESIKKAFSEYQNGKPVAHILGTKFFYRSEFIVTPDVLIPRTETEILVEKSLNTLSEKAQTIFDFGAGSGCIGLSIAKERSDCTIHLFEKSLKALGVCKKNAEKLDLSNVEFHQADLSSPDFVAILKERADLIVSNPPYIKEGDPRVQTSVHLYEPYEALYCADEGLEVPRKWISLSYQVLKPGGHYLFEFGQGQEIPLSDFIASTDYSIIEKIPDYAGIDRFFKLKKE
jgi:release factor glutamine methyltransferase